jgi:hypothetical protein
MKTTKPVEKRAEPALTFHVRKHVGEFWISYMLVRAENAKKDSLKDCLLVDASALAEIFALHNRLYAALHPMALDACSVDDVYTESRAAADAFLQADLKKDGQCRMSFKRFLVCSLGRSQFSSQ